MGEKDFGRTDLVIHIVTGAETYCGIETWQLKANHRYYEYLDDHSNVNCDACRERKAKLDERKRGHHGPSKSKVWDGF